MSLSVNSVCLDIPLLGMPNRRLFSRATLGSRFVGGNLYEKQNVQYISALSNITINLEKGDRVALLGRNGAGKSTLLKVLARIYKPSSGRVISTGRTGVLLDVGATLLEELTGFECINLFADIKRVPKTNLEELVDYVQDFSELGDYLELPIRTYSSGMRSRLAAALATSIHYDILLIDEGIGAGDQRFQKKLNNRINEFLGSVPILVLASHSPEMVKQFCSKGLVLEKGQMEFYGEIQAALHYYDSELG